MKSGTLAKQRLRTALFRDRREISAVITKTVCEEITSLIGEYFDTDNSTASLYVDETDGNMRKVYYSVEIK